MKTPSNGKLLTGIALLMIAFPALAEHHGHGGGYSHGYGHRDGGYRGGEIRHFEHYDVNVWRGGMWRHDMHEGQLGWWWIVGGIWYFYPTPVYPYPDPYVPSTVVIQTPAAPTAPVAPPAPVAQPAPQVWYYCNESKGYYPYVSSCPSGWQVVPATPPDVTPR